MLSVIRLSVVMLNVIMLSVVAPIGFHSRTDPELNRLLSLSPHSLLMLLPFQTQYQDATSLYQLKIIFLKNSPKDGKTSF
jgi:hypothetical protein